MVGALSGAIFARRFQTTTLKTIDDDELLTALHPFISQGWPITTADGGTERISTTTKALGHHAQQVGHRVPAGAFPVLEGEDPAMAFQQGLACSFQQLQTFLNGA